MLGYIVFLLVGICVGAWFCSKPSLPVLCPLKTADAYLLPTNWPMHHSTTQSVDVIDQDDEDRGSTPGILHYVAISGFNILNGGANVQ